MVVFTGSTVLGGASGPSLEFLNSFHMPCIKSVSGGCDTSKGVIGGLIAVVRGSDTWARQNHRTTAWLLRVPGEQTLKPDSYLHVTGITGICFWCQELVCNFACVNEYSDNSVQ